MSSSRLEMKGRNGRVAVFAGLRTPFTRIATHFRDTNAIELGVMLVNELLARNDLAKQQVSSLCSG